MLFKKQHRGVSGPVRGFPIDNTQFRVDVHSGFFGEPVTKVTSREESALAAASAAAVSSAFPGMAVALVVHIAIPMMLSFNFSRRLPSPLAVAPLLPDMWR